MRVKGREVLTATSVKLHLADVSDERQTAPCRPQWAPPTAGPHLTRWVDRLIVWGARDGSFCLTLSRERNRVLRSQYGNEPRNEANSHLEIMLYLMSPLTHEGVLSSLTIWVLCISIAPQKVCCLCLIIASFIILWNKYTWHRCFVLLIT